MLLTYSKFKRAEKYEKSEKAGRGLAGRLR